MQHIWKVSAKEVECATALEFKTPARIWEEGQYMSWRADKMRISKEIYPEIIGKAKLVSVLVENRQIYVIINICMLHKNKEENFN